MRRWGILITLIYAVILAGLLVPALYRLAGLGKVSPEALLEGIPFWLPYLALLVAGQASLLFLSVDTSWRRLRPRLRIVYSATLAGMLTALLMVALAWSLAAALLGDDAVPDNGYSVLLIWGGLWFTWAAVFYVYYQKQDTAFATTVSWLLKGSVLELLIAVPCHIIVRSRGDCSAPAATGFGIVTGLAIMLLCFGPGVLALYKRRLQRYPHQSKT